jgi:hypothetical protein
MIAVIGPPLVLGGVLDNSSPVKNDIPLNATNGPEVTFLDVDTDANLTYAFPDGESSGNKVQWQSANGNITLTANSQTTIDVASITGTWTNLTAMGGSSVELTVDPGNKQTVRVKNADTLNFTDVSLDDGTVDFVVTGSGNPTVNITGLSATAVAAKSTNGDFIDGDMVESGEASLTIDTNDENIVLESSSGSTPSLTDEAPTGRVDGFPTKVNATVNDDDFADDEVDVEFEVNGTTIGTDTVTSNGGAAEVSINAGLGEHTVTATATDSYGNEQTATWTFSTPENLTIRQVTSPHSIIDDRTVDATFFDGDTIIEKSTSDGNISMEDIPGKENIIVSLDAATGTNPSEYHTVETLVLDFTKQQTAYMLNASKASRTVRFEIDDRTGQFEDNGGMVLVQKPINRTSFDVPQWETVYADRFGPKGAAGELEDGQRYRIKVRNNDNDERILGTYTADADETVTLEVGDVTVKPEGGDRAFEWNATYDKSTNTRYVRFYYNDTEDETDNIWVEIYEFGNESNVLASNQSFGGPYGTFSFSEPVPSDEENTTWAVKATIDRGDETIQIIEPVGPTQPVLQGIPNYLKVLISIGSILIVAGLFSQLNGHIGGLVVAGLGAIFWFADFLPPDTGIGVVVLAMITAGVIFIRERQVSAV